MLIVPEESELTRPYWEGARQGELRLQSCASCTHVWHPPLPRCPRCANADVSWITASGRGVIHTFTIVQQAAHPAFADRLPYAVVLVRLDEGPLVIGNVLGSAPTDLAIDQAVEVTFEEIDEGVVLPQFRLAGTTASRS